MSKMPFNSGGKFVAARAFTFGSKSYKPGEAFDWRKIACSERKLRIMYDTRRIVTLDEFKKRSTPTPIPVIGAPEQVTKKVTPKVKTEESPPDTGEVAEKKKRKPRKKKATS